MDTATLGLAGMWGLLVSIIVLVFDKRLHPEPEIKLLLALGLCLLPFLAIFVVGLFTQGISDIETPFGQAIGKGLEAMGASQTTHGAMKVSARVKRPRVAPTGSPGDIPQQGG